MSDQRDPLGESPIPHGGWKCLFKTLIILTGVFLVIVSFQMSFVWKNASFNAPVAISVFGLALIVWQLWLNPAPYFHWLRDYRNRNIRKRFIWAHNCEELKTSSDTIRQVSVPVLRRLGHNPRPCQCWGRGNDFLEIRHQVSGWGKSPGLVYYCGFPFGLRHEGGLEWGITNDGDQLKITDPYGISRMYTEWEALALFVPFMREANVMGGVLPYGWERFDRALLDSLSALQEVQARGSATLAQIKGVICMFDAKDRLPYGKEGQDIRQHLNRLLECASAGYETVDPELLETPLERRSRERKAARSRQPVETSAVLS